MVFFQGHIFLLIDLQENFEILSVGGAGGGGIEIKR